MSNVAIIYSLYKCWTNMILSEEKPIEFRTKLPKLLNIGTKILLYETKKNGGVGAIVGECVVKDIINVLNEDGKWPLIGCYPFAHYYARNVLEDDALADYIHNVKKELDSFTNYRYGSLLSYAFSEDEIKSLRDTGHLLDLLKISPNEKCWRILKDKEKGDSFESDCDEWLKKIGFYNDMNESYYTYGIVLCNVVRYDKPKKISDFTGLNGKSIYNPPQSFCYVNMTL